MAAAHRRDHEHGLGAEAVTLTWWRLCTWDGRAVTVCHDCRLDSGFLPRREAEAMAAGHRELTREVSVKLCALIEDSRGVTVP